MAVSKLGVDLYNADSWYGARARHPSCNSKLASFSYHDIKLFSSNSVVFAFERHTPFAVPPVPVHEVWARFFGSSMKDDSVIHRPTASRPFRFPELGRRTQTLEAVGKEYYEFRAQLMIRNNEGLTKTYNRFHDPDERDPDIVRSCASCTTRWTARCSTRTAGPTPPTCEFILDYEEDEEETPGKAAEEEALALPLARRRPRRGARPAAGAERPAGQGRGTCRRGFRRAAQYRPQGQSAKKRRNPGTTPLLDRLESVSFATAYSTSVALSITTSQADRLQ